MRRLRYEVQTSAEISPASEALIMFWMGRMQLLSFIKAEGLRPENAGRPGKASGYTSTLENLAPRMASFS